MFTKQHNQKISNHQYRFWIIIIILAFQISTVIQSNEFIVINNDRETESENSLNKHDSYSENKDLSSIEYSPFDFSQSLLSNYITKESLETNDIYAEHLEILVGNENSVFVQFNLLGGNLNIPITLTELEDAKVTTFGLTMVDQSMIQNYWSQALWKVQNGIILQFYTENTDGYSQAISNVNPLVAKWSDYLNLTLQPLYGNYNEIEDSSALFYYGILTGSELGLKINNYWQDQELNGGLADIVKEKDFSIEPIKLSALILTINTEFADQWITFRSTAWIEKQGIENIEDNYQLSIANLTNETYHGPDIKSNISLVTYRLPYLANIVSVEPLSDNPLSEVMGSFNWTLKLNYNNIYIENNHTDIKIMYNFNLDSLLNRPNIIAKAEVHNDQATSGIFNYSCTFSNIGQDDAYNLTSFIEFGEKPANFTLPVFNDNVYIFDPDLVVFYDWYFTGNVSETPYPWASVYNLSIVGWFRFKDNGSLFQPISELNEAETALEINWIETLDLLYYAKDFFTFEYSDLLTSIEIDRPSNSIYGLYFAPTDLEIGENITLWWSITNLPKDDDIFLDLNTEFNIDGANTTITFTGNNISLSEAFVDTALDDGWDFRLISPAELKTGQLFTYDDLFGHEYFGWANGFGSQLYDDEATLIVNIESDNTVARMGEDINLTLKITNIGDAIASEIELTGYYSILNTNMEIEKQDSFIYLLLDQDLNPGQSITYNLNFSTNNILGIVPITFAIDYYTESDQQEISHPFGTFKYEKILSNLEIFTIFPSLYKEGKMESSFPTPKIISSSEIIANTDWTQMSKINYITNISNVGEESTSVSLTTILQTEAFIFIPVLSNITIDGMEYSLNQNYISYLDEDLGILILHISDLDLAINSTITINLVLQLNNPTEFIIPPIIIEYHTKHHIYSTEQPSKRSLLDEELNNNEIPFKYKIGYVYSSETTNTNWEAYSNPLFGNISKFIEDLNIDFIFPIINLNISTLGLLMILPLVILIYRERKRH